MCMKTDEGNGFMSRGKKLQLLSPMSGEIFALEEVPDEVFSQKMVGDGLAILPEEGLVCAPLAGEIVALFPTGHALGIRSPEGLEVLIHFGVETVALKGEGFTLYVAKGQQVKAGEKLIFADLDYIREHAPSLLSPVVLTNMEKVESWEASAQGAIAMGEDFMSVVLKN